MRPLVVAVVIVTLVGCGGGRDAGETYGLEPTRSCLADAGLRTRTDALDFVASTALGGALRAELTGNTVTVAFGETPEDAVRTEEAYRKFAPRRLKINDVLRRDRNVVLLWAVPPSDEDERRVGACLQG